jgi:ribosome-associated heat shock protein Hsp15
MSSESGVRVDVWLWAARFYKTRNLAKQAIEGGKIEVNGAAIKPARMLRVGDRLRISRGIERFAIEVTALSATRGPASVAQMLYQETAESLAARESEREMRRLTGASMDHPHNRPDKHSRKLLREFKEGGR